MPGKNPFKENQPQEATAGDSITNLSRAKVFRVFTLGGEIREYVLSSWQSAMNQNGHYADIETVNLFFDAAGNPLLENSAGMSHSGLFIADNSSRALCSSMFHPSTVSRVILIGQDGMLTQTGAICSHCLRRRRLVAFVIGIIGLAVFIGIYKGTGFF